MEGTRTDVGEAVQGEVVFGAANVTGRIQVEMWGIREEGVRGPWPKRNITVEFSESFADDEGLERALDAFRATVLEAARR